MLWNELYGKENEPSDKQVAEFVDTPLWGDLEDYLRQTYGVQPKLSYSGCSMDNGIWKGWNVKYKKGGKALCTLYPKQGYFLSLISIGTKEIDGADLIIPLCDDYTQNLYNKAEFGHFGKMLAVEVKNEDILRDVRNLIALRVSPAKRNGA